MNHLKLNELVIAIAASNYEPSLLHPNALKYSGVIPHEWELAQQPVISQQGSQVTFKNGLQIVAQPGRCLFMESWGDQSEAELEAPPVARRYISTLPNLNYQAVGINLRGYIPFEGDAAGPQTYIEQHLLQAGDWQSCGANAVHSEINLVYVLEDRRLNLTINSATIQRPEQEPLPILLFSGNFEYRLDAQPAVERSTQIQTIVESWPQDLSKFREVVAQFPTCETASDAAVVPAEVAAVV